MTISGIYSIMWIMQNNKIHTVEEKMDYIEAEKLYMESVRIRSEKGYSSKEAFDILLKSAHGGYIDAIVAVDMSYRDGGWGTEKNTAEALKWFTLAADRGDASGIACLDDVYQDLYGDAWEDYYVPAMECYAAMGYQEAIECLASKRKYGLIGQKGKQSNDNASRRTQENTGTMKLPSGAGRTEYNRIKLFILIICIIFCVFFLARC